MANYNCRICKSKVKKDIERAISEGKSFRDVAKHYLDKFDCDLHLLEQSIATHIKKHYSNTGSNSSELTPEDLELLERFKKGEVEFDEASRVIATIAFEKILATPGSIQVRDWLQSELVKIKRQELSEKNNWAMEMINRMFMGKLPPRNCTKCGNPFIQDELEEEIKEGDIVGYHPSTDNL